MLEAEMAAAAAEKAVLSRIDASDPLRDARLKNMNEKAYDLANGPTATLLPAVELSSVVAAAVAVLVFGFVLATKGALPSALPVAGDVCWSIE